MNRQRQIQQEQETQSSSGQNTSQSGSRQNQNPGEQSGMWGWLQNTGDWIADKYNSVTTGVSDWAGGVRDSANEIWDVVESSNFSAKDGIWSLDTDLDEIQDVAGLEGISLDREASDNTVNMEINRNTGVLTLRCSNLALNALSFDGFSVQSVSLSDVHIEVENASVDAGFLGTLSAKKGEKTNAPQNVSLRAGSIVGRGVKFADPTINNGEAIEIDSITLESFRLNANGSKDLFEDAPNQASFSVANAILNGIKTKQGGQDVSGNVALNGAGGSFDAQAGTGALSINDLQGSQLVAGGNQIENTQFKGVQASVAPSQSGHVAHISANHGAVRGIDTASIDAGSASADGISAQFNTNTQALSAVASKVNAHNVSGMDASISAINANDLRVASDLDDNQHSGAVGSVYAQGIKHGDSSIGHASLSNLAGSSSASGQTATLGSATASQLSGYGHNADRLTIGGASVSNVGNTSSAKLNNAAVHGYSSEYATLDRASIGNVDLQHSDGRTSGSVGNISGTNINGMGTSASSLSVDGTNFSHSEAGSSLSIGDAMAHDVNAYGGSAGIVSVKNASAHGNADLTQSGFNIERVSGQDMSHAEGSLGSLELTDVNGSRNNNSYQASLGTVSATNGNLKKLGSVESIYGSNASVGATLGNQTTYNANLDTLSAQGVKGHTFGTTIDSATFNGAEFSGVDTNEMHAKLASGHVNNFAMQGGTIERAAIKNASGDVKDGYGNVRLGEVNFTNAQYEDVLRAGSGVATNLRAHGTAESQQGSLEGANVNDITVTQPQSVSQIGQASLSNGQFAHHGNGKGSIGVGNVGAQDIQVDISDMDKSASVSGSNSEPVANVDFNELLSTGARRLDSASIQAEVGLKPGTIGSGIGSVGVDAGTMLSADVNVANNRIQDGSKITANKALDTVAFTSVKGGYVEDGQLKADVRGWFDMGISENINGMVGLGGKNLHSLGDYAGAIAQMPESESNSSENPIDLSTLRAKGNASLSDGTVSAGDASVELAGASSGSNAMTFEATHQQVAMKFAQLLASSFQLNTAMGSGQTGEVAVDNGALTVNPQKGTARGLIDSVSVSDIQIQN